MFSSDPLNTSEAKKKRVITVKGVIVITWLLVILCGMTGIFWYSDWKYSLPTPLPPHYHPVSTGAHIDLKGKLSVSPDKPVFIHFFNPDCPCSRFNIPYFKSLAKQYGDRISFAIVVLNNTAYTEREIQNKFDLTIPVSFDSSIAAVCGVYSTPQAVLLDSNQCLYYRGNYNKSRYCSDNKSNYARMAIDSLVNNNHRPMFDTYALRAYGCQLPGCTPK